MKLNILLLLITIIYARKRTTTCTYSYLDEPCQTDYCLPNAILLSSGFDITDGSYRSNVLGLVWGNNYYTNPYTGTKYTIPYGVTVLPLDSSNELTGTIIIHNISESEQWQSDMYMSNTDYIVGMSSNTEESYRFITAQYSQNSQLGYTLYNSNIYQVIIPYDQQILDDQTYEAIMMLPYEYNQNLYFQFIGSYGTHYQIESKFGMKYKFISSFKECTIYTRSESYVYTQVETDGWIHSDSHTTYSGQSTTDSYYESRRYVYESFEGGNMSYHDSDQWDLWEESCYVNMIDPIQTSMKLKEIYLLINDTIKQNNMKRAYLEYLQMKKDQQTILIEEKKKSVQPVSFVSYKITNGMIEYIHPQVKINMDSNTESDIFTDDKIVAICPGGITVDYFGSKFFGIDNFYCKRDESGKVSVKHYFYGFNGLTFIKTGPYDGYNCGDTSVVKYDPFTKQMVKDYWTGYVNYNGHESIYPLINYDLQVTEYQVSYKENINYTSYSQDGVYSDYISSTTSYGHYDSGFKSGIGFNAFAICALNCEYIIVNIDINGQVIQECGC
jgi:hypothetical protein